jgi:3-dehydroquinate dehydratase
VAPAADAVVAGLGADGYSHVVEMLPYLPIPEK